MTSCNKTAYDDKQFALRKAEVINRANKINGGQKEQLRAYKCEKCEYWHLSSMTKDSFKSLVNTPPEDRLPKLPRIKKLNWIDKLRKKYKKL